MAVVRVDKNSNFTTMAKYHLKEKGMSLKAKGLMSLMLSLPDDWDYTIKGLVTLSRDNESAVTSALNELKSLGFLEVLKKMPNETTSGRIEYEYIVHEKPEKQEGKKQGVENLGLEFQGVENHGLLNNKELNTYELNTEDINTEVFKKESIKKKRETFTKPTIQEISDYCNSRGNTVNPDKFFAYYESNGWMVGRKKMVDWKAAVRTWELNEKERASTQNTGSRRGQTICPDLYFSNDKCRESLKNEVVPF